MELWESIRKARIKAGLTQEELADKVGVHRCTASLWEKKPGKGEEDRQPSWTTLKKIAEVTNSKAIMGLVAKRKKK